MTSLPLTEFLAVLLARLLDPTDGVAARYGSPCGAYDRVPDDAALPFVALERVDLGAEESLGGTLMVVRATLGIYHALPSWGAVGGVLEAAAESVTAAPLTASGVWRFRDARIVSARLFAEDLADGRVVRRGELTTETMAHDEG